MHPLVDRVAAYSWRIIVICAVGWGALVLLGRLRVVFVPIVVALFLTRVLSPLSGWLRRHRVPPALASSIALLAALVVLGGTFAVTGRAVSGQFTELPDTVSNGVDRVETWLVEDSPFSVDRAELKQFREDVRDGLERALTSGGGGQLVNGAVLVAETVAGLLLALVLTFFFLKDGARLGKWLLRHVPDDRQRVARRMGQAAWSTLGGYLRGAAALGAVEGTVIGVAMLIVGADLAVLVGVLTLLAAFVPVVGAIVAGMMAVLVTLVTAGPGAALAIAIVALLVQQLDNDLLAPWIYGRALQLHAAVVLVSITAGTALFGLIGAFLAVPVVAVTVSAITAMRALPEGRDVLAGQPVLPSAPAVTTVVIDQRASDPSADDPV